jgi:hypothetical protein
MREVYRARDTKLNRGRRTQTAAERVCRRPESARALQREAQTLAGLTAIAIELVDPSALADRIGRVARGFRDS